MIGLGFGVEDHDPQVLEDALHALVVPSPERDPGKSSRRSKRLRMERRECLL